MNTSKLTSKVMTALAVVLGSTMLGFASPCSDTPTKPCAFGYQVKIMVKTTGSSVIPNCGPCNTKDCVRVPATRRLVGFIYSKSDASDTCGCDVWDKTEILLWDYDTHKALKPTTAKFDVLDRIYTGDSTTAELTFSLDGMTFAGFGRTAKRDGIMTLKWANGFCAGFLESPKCVDCFECGDIVPAKAWTICGDPSKEPDSECDKTSAYGKWTIEWSPTVYNKVINGMDLMPGGYWEANEPVPFDFE